MSYQDEKLSKYASFYNIVKNSYYEANKDVLECQICNLLIIGPKQCPYCQNSLCYQCASKIKKCPISGKEVIFCKSIMLNKLLSKLSFFCINCKEEIMFDNLITHYEEPDKCKNFKFSNKDKEIDNGKDISNKEELFIKTKEPESKINNDELIPKPVIRKEANPKNIETQINIISKEKRLDFSNINSNKWIKLPGALKQIYVSNYGVYGVNKYNNIYYREGIDLNNKIGNSWILIDGALQYISVGKYGFGVLIQIMKFITEIMWININQLEENG